jgi:formate dehydrogenase subunit gamma
LTDQADHAPVPVQASSTFPGSRRILRFDRVERAAHWATALLFAILMATALPLYFVQVNQFVGRRVLVENIHTWSGVALPIPLIISLAGPWGGRLRHDVRRCNLWTASEVRWLRSLGRRSVSRPDKFNPGQKLNALFIAGAIVVMLGTGSILKWYRFFPLDWRTGATFVHDVLALAIFIVVIGHIVFALTHRQALRSMLTGWVTESWARTHASGWLEQEDVASGGQESPPSR